MFGAYFKQLLHLGTPDRPAPPPEPDAMSRLASSYQEIQDYVRQETRREETSEGLLTRGDTLRHQELRKQAVLSFRQDVLGLHLRLGTGLTAEQLPRLARMLRAHLPASGPSQTLEEQIDVAVGQRLFLECGRLCWERLEALMRQAEVCWPVPEGLVASRNERELEAVLAQHREEIRQNLLAMSAGACAELLQGEVEVWKHVYPEPGGSLWFQTALKAVGAALRAQLFVAALEAWLWRSQELDQALQRLLQAHVKACQEMAAEPSLADALELSRRIQDLCQHAIPDLVWATIATRLHWEGPGTPTIATLADGLELVDPVCGMSLKAEQVADRAGSGARTVYFCSTSCRRRFESEPAERWQP